MAGATARTLQWVTKSTNAPDTPCDATRRDAT
eukprot:CAMPEP_0181204628 /NCGR_PEP_ID=MMETSP1096-20121128/20040_1 /TAXON_ID=156174 ORGANISM="Chrysochromulina ericina, Strain CCMP281" /NCGR_SAMPLE_ID=MMETSP1096 /ASSEMBLY_ACC=CAM_ASM_000453 /LENGTH=31 /DNA_ID= /DNA_START= /DNA_END= /DNA_ORIENTATION=